MDSPTSLLVTAISGLCLAICFMFRTLVASQERRVTELAAAHKAASEAQEEAFLRLSQELRSVWAALDRMNRITAVRLCASPNIAPELKDDAAEAISEIDRESKYRDKK